MLFESFEDPGLSQFSYLLACPLSGRAAVVDPRRDVDVYLAFAEGHDLRITHVLETHVHADFASGARELARRTGAELFVSGHDVGEQYEVAFAHRDLRDGEAISLGSVRLEARHTPGHTPEHLSYVVYDETRSETEPQLLLSGDFLFVGSLGRPDLLGEEASEGLAERMFDSVRGVLAELPNGVELRPGHGAGSMCGSGMTGRALSTLGYERATNPYLDPELTRDAFVERLLASAPPLPDYYRRMKALNAAGPPLLGGLPELERLSPERFADLAGRRYTVVDLRDTLAFGAAHIAGSFGIAASDILSQWAAWVVPYDRPILLVPPAADGDVEEAVQALIRVGLDDLVGVLEGGMDAWILAGLPTRRLDTISVGELQSRLDLDGEDVQVLDVRSQSEWDEGHLDGALHVMAGELEEHLDGLPERQAPLAIYCDTGYRSTVAASVLERAGYERLLNVVGGMTAWESAGQPTIHS